MSIEDDIPPLSQDTAELYVALAVDGGLSPEDAAVLNEMMADDPALATLYAQLETTEASLKNALSGVAAAPIPLSLARAASTVVETANVNDPAIRRFPWGAIAAGFALAMISIGPGAFLFGRDTGQKVAIAAAPGWIDQVAEYHRLYAKEERHLVAVRADELDHIVTWLSRRIGTPIQVPDLTGEGLEFEGARLLVAAGKPVVQLMYSQADGRVVGYCFFASEDANQGAVSGSRGDLNFTSWSGGGLKHIVIGWDDPERLDNVRMDIETGISL